VDGVPRSPRLQVAGGVYHVMCHAVSRGPLFRVESDCSHYLSILGTTCRTFDWVCHAYCLMTTHVHILIRTAEPNLARGMQALSSTFAVRMNRRYDGIGHVFSRRYKSVLAESEGHVLELSRYIPANPVRASMVDDPVEWPWSSYRATAGLAPSPSFLADGWLLAHFGADVERARERYRDFVADGIEKWRAEQAAQRAA
jgi:putative transposase